MLLRSDFHDYQEVAFDFGLRHPKCALWLDLGLGKTATALTIIAERLDSFQISGALVVAPLRVAKKVWSDEVQKWAHLRHLRVARIVGTAKQRLAALRTKADIHVINVENLPWLEDIIGRKNTRWGLVVFDEASMFKNRDTKRFKTAARLSGVCDYALELTATPASNSYVDLWAQFYLLDRGQRLGPTITGYRDRFFRAVPTGENSTKYLPRKGAEETIHALIQDITLTMRARDHLKSLPPVLPPIDVPVELPEKVMAAYLDFERHCVLETVAGKTIEATNAMALNTKLAQFTNGHVYDEDKGVHPIHDTKIAALRELLDEAGDEPVLIAYAYRSDLDRLQREFPDAEVFGKDMGIIDRWHRGEVKRLLVHPASAAHGIDGLQHAGNIVVWFGLTWSLERYLQLVGRLDRQGQTRSVRSYRLYCPGTVDDDFLAALNGKDASQNGLLEATKRRVDRVLAQA